MGYPSSLMRMPRWLRHSLSLMAVLATAAGVSALCLASASGRLVHVSARQASSISDKRPAENASVLAGGSVATRAAEPAEGAATAIAARRTAGHRAGLAEGFAARMPVRHRSRTREGATGGAPRPGSWPDETEGAADHAGVRTWPGAPSPSLGPPMRLRRRSRSPVTAAFHRASKVRWAHTVHRYLNRNPLRNRRPNQLLNPNPNRNPNQLRNLNLNRRPNRTAGTRPGT